MICHTTYYFIRIYFLFLSVPFSLCIYPIPSTPTVSVCCTSYNPVSYHFSVSLSPSISLSFPFSSFFGRSPSCFPFPRGNPLSPLFPQCDTVLEFSTTFSICYCDSVKVTPLYHNKGLRRTLTAVERGTHKKFTRFTHREILNFV